MSQLVRIKGLEPRSDYVVHFLFSNGEERDIDLKPYLTGPIFEPLAQNHSEFLQMFVDPDGETIAWPNGADIDPDVLFLGLKPASQDLQAMPVCDDEANERKRILDRRKKA